jgi:transcriptional regulator with XRE-family HTH domain
MDQDVGRCLITERLAEKGWTQQKLADVTNFDFRQISLWATNERVLMLKNAFIIANALGCDPRALYQHGYRLMSRQA